jgi:hypothetical protein
MKQGVKEGPTGAGQGEAAISAPGPKGGGNAGCDERKADIPDEMDAVGPHHGKAWRPFVEPVRIREDQNPCRQPQ